MECSQSFVICDPEWSAGVLCYLRSSFPGSLPKVRVERERSSPGINDPKQYPEDTEEGFYHERNRKGR